MRKGKKNLRFKNLRFTIGKTYSFTIYPDSYRDYDLRLGKPIHLRFKDLRFTIKSTKPLLREGVSLRDALSKSCENFEIWYCCHNPLQVRVAMREG